MEQDNQLIIKTLQQFLREECVNLGVGWSGLLFWDDLRSDEQTRIVDVSYTHNSVENGSADREMRVKLTFYIVCDGDKPIELVRVDAGFNLQDGNGEIWDGIVIDDLPTRQWVQLVNQCPFRYSAKSFETLHYGDEIIYHGEGELSNHTFLITDFKITGNVVEVSGTSGTKITAPCNWFS